MYEIIEYYQSLASKFDSRIMLVPGVVVVALGLCIWLAGLRWRKVLGATAGGVIFVSLGLCLGDYGVIMLLVVSLIGMTIGVLVEKITLGVFGVLMSLILVLAAVSMFCGNLDIKNYPRWPQYEQSGVIIGFSQCVEITRTLGMFVLPKMLDNIKSTRLIAICVSFFAMAIAGFTAVTRPRVFIAVISSSLGSAVIFAGLIMLLFYKGFRLVGYMSGKSPYYALVVFAMLVFGTAVQLVLSPPAAEQTQENSPEKNGDKK
jgi:hypothetical protein